MSVSKMNVRLDLGEDNMASSQHGHPLQSAGNHASKKLEPPFNKDIETEYSKVHVENLTEQTPFNH